MRWGIIWWLLCLVTLGCNNSSDSSFELTDRPWINASEFENNPRLHAKPNQVVIFNIDDKSSRDSNAVHRIPYYVSEEAYFSLRLDTKEPCVSEIKAVNGSGITAMDINLENPSARVRLTEGRYLFTVVRITPIPEHCTVFFMHHPMANEKAREKLSFKGASDELMTGLFDKGIYRMFGQLNSNQTAYDLFLPDYFSPDHRGDKAYSMRLNQNIIFAATQVAPDLNFTSLPVSSTDPGFLLELFYDPSKDNMNDSWMIQDFYKDLFSCMFSPTNCDVPVNPDDYGYLCHLDSVKQSYFPYQGRQPILAFANPNKMTTTGCYYFDNNNSDYYRFTVDYWDAMAAIKNPRDLAFGIYNSLCPKDLSPCQWQFSSAQSAGYVQYSLNPYATSLLGAVSLATAATPGYDRIRLTELYRYYRDASKLKDTNGEYLINEGEVIQCTGANYSGEAVVLNADTNYLLLPIALQDYDDKTFNVGSVMLSGNTATITFAESTTIGQSNPNTASMNLKANGSNGTIGVRVFRAIEVIFSNDCPSCNLAEVEIEGSNFKGRDFSRAYFTKAKIKGSVFDNAILTGADFTLATMIGNSYISANLTDAVMQGANFSNSNFKGANLCMAKLGLFGSLSVGAILNGSYLQDANLAYADLSGASMQYVSFHSTTPGGECTPDKYCKIGACASAYKAQMYATDLSNAHLSGTSFIGAQIMKARFVNAFAMSANLTDAFLTSDSPSGDMTDFTGAILIGADFSKAVNPNAGVNKVKDAYLDDPSITYSSRTAISFLSSIYTNFLGPNYSSTTVCPQFSVKNTTVIPPKTDNTIICPNGNVGPCTGKDWIASKPMDNSLIIINNSGQLSMPSGCNGKTEPFW